MKSKLVFILFSILFSTQVLADRLEIENTFGVKAERYHQFKAVLYKGNGEVLDVTSDTRFQAFGVRERSRGEFYLEIPRIGTIGRYFSLNLSATYTGETGILTDSEYIQVDTTPDYLDIRGSYSTRSGGTIFMRAYGVYAGRRIELTQKGQWRATYGRVNSWGHYRAPVLRDRRSVYDRVTFSFGWRTQTTQVLVRN